MFWLSIWAQVIAVAHVRMSLRRNSNATRRYVVKKELKMVAVAGILLGYFAFAWIPFVVFEFYTIHCVATHTEWESCESNCYLRFIRRFVDTIWTSLFSKVAVAKKKIQTNERSTLSPIRSPEC